MTDQEIIKALECCTSNGGDCNICPQHSTTCVNDLLMSSLDLINRQQAKIGELQGNLKFVRGIVERQKAGIRQLRKQREFRREYLGYFPKLERAEAVREFAEKVKEATYHYYDSDIDEFVKEMEK